MAPLLSTQPNKLGTSPISQLIVELGFPSMLSMAIMAVYNLADTFWVAKLGASALAALTIVFPYQMLLVALGAGTGAGFSSLLSRRFGAGRHVETNRIVGQMLPLSLLFGLVFLVATQWLAHPLLHLFGTKPAYHQLAHDYLTIIGFGAFFTFFSMIANNCFRGAGNTTIPLLSMTLAAVVNIILDPIMIFGYGPMPALGVAGAAWATVIAQALGASLAAKFLFGARSAYNFKWSFLLLSVKQLKAIFAVGLPTIIMQCLASIVIMVSNRLLAPYGTAAVATNGLIFRILMMIIMPIAGLAHGLMPIVGYNYAANNFRRLWQAIRIAAIGSASFIGIGYLLIIIFPGFWIQFFSQDQAVVPLATKAIVQVMLLIPLMGPFFMWVTTFQGLGKGGTALILTSLRPCLLLLFLFFLPRWFRLSGIWLAFPLADGLAFFMALLTIRHEYGQQKTIHCHHQQDLACQDIEPAPLG